MATTKQRINITTDTELHNALKSVARRDNVPIATKAAELIVVGLGLEEDLALSALADKRSRDRSELVSHEDAWL